MFFKKDEDAYIKAQHGGIKLIVNNDKLGYGNNTGVKIVYSYNFYIRRIKIEVFLGQNDKIIDSLAAKDFFKEFATVYYFKDKGHLL